MVSPSPAVLRVREVSGCLAGARPGTSAGESDQLILAPLTAIEAAAVAGWRYPPPHDFYDGSEAEVPVMLDPANHYRAVHVGGWSVGFVCAGRDARVAGQAAAERTQDIGWGFHPELVGRGRASRWAARAADLLARESSPERQRVVIASWNARSLAAARRMGFGDPASLRNDVGEWTVLTRPIREGLRSSTGR